MIWVSVGESTATEVMQMTKRLSGKRYLVVGGDPKALKQIPAKRCGRRATTNWLSIRNGTVLPIQVWSVESGCGRFGHCRVPKKWEENPQLGSWVSHLRERKKAVQDIGTSALSSLAVSANDPGYCCRVSWMKSKWPSSTV